MGARVAVFIDSQNTYMGARTAFEGGRGALPNRGQIRPWALGELICSRTPTGVEGGRALSEVRAYVGQPSSSRDSRGYGAQRRQVAGWQRDGVTVISRPLRYPPGYPDTKPEEKGIDVSLAIDFVAGAVDGRFDVGVIFSTDTDLKPALEFVLSRSHLNVRAEVAAWWAPPDTNAPLSVDGHHVWCHRLYESDYLKVRDLTVYAR